MEAQTHRLRHSLHGGSRQGNFGNENCGQRQGTNCGELVHEEVLDFAMVNDKDVGASARHVNVRREMETGL